MQEKEKEETERAQGQSLNEVQSLHPSTPFILQKIQFIYSGNVQINSIFREAERSKWYIYETIEVNSIFTSKQIIKYRAYL